MQVGDSVTVPIGLLRRAVRCLWSYGPADLAASLQSHIPPERLPKRKDCSMATEKTTGVCVIPKHIIPADTPHFLFISAEVAAFAEAMRREANNPQMAIDISEPEDWDDRYEVHLSER